MALKLSPVLFLLFALACSENSHATDAGSGPMCEYVGRAYEDQTELCGFDGCNGCYCNPDYTAGVGCTLIGCLPAIGLAQVELEGACARTMWHLDGAASATTLALFDDGAFRWLAIDCESSSHDLGVWSEDGGTIALAPAPGREDFAWVDGSSHTTFELTRNGKNLSSGAQTWQTGGLCPVCESPDAGAQDGGSSDAGVKTKALCANPFSHCNAQTVKCTVRF